MAEQYGDQQQHRCKSPATAQNPTQDARPGAELRAGLIPILTAQPGAWNLFLAPYKSQCPRKGCSLPFQHPTMIQAMGLIEGAGLLPQPGRNKG